MDEFPKLLIVLGISIALVGVLWLGWTRVFGGTQMPGTFVFQGENLTCVVPLLGSILLSIILTIVLNVILRAMNK
jgi:hypothetical protein